MGGVESVEWGGVGWVNSPISHNYVLFEFSVSYRDSPAPLGAKTSN